MLEITNEKVSKWFMFNFLLEIKKGETFILYKQAEQNQVHNAKAKTRQNIPFAPHMQLPFEEGFCAKLIH